MYLSPTEYQHLLISKKKDPNIYLFFWSFTCRLVPTFTVILEDMDGLIRVHSKEREK